MIELSRLSFYTLEIVVKTIVIVYQIAYIIDEMHYKRNLNTGNSYRRFFYFLLTDLKCQAII